MNNETLFTVYETTSADFETISANKETTLADNETTSANNETLFADFETKFADFVQEIKSIFALLNVLSNNIGSCFRGIRCFASRFDICLNYLLYHSELRE